MKKTAKEIFTSVVKGTNFMTPKVLRYYKILDGACELSIGDGIGLRTKRYGVTVVKNGEHNHELSKPFASEEAAMRYIAKLKIYDLRGM